jgi:hypothetical protein
VDAGDSRPKFVPAAGYGSPSPSFGSASKGDDVPLRLTIVASRWQRPSVKPTQFCAPAKVDQATSAKATRMRFIMMSRRLVEEYTIGMPARGFRR